MSGRRRVRRLPAGNYMAGGRRRCGAITTCVRAQNTDKILPGETRERCEWIAGARDVASGRLVSAPWLADLTSGREKNCGSAQVVTGRSKNSAWNGRVIVDSEAGPASALIRGYRATGQDGRSGGAGGLFIPWRNLLLENPTTFWQNKRPLIG